MHVLLLILGEFVLVCTEVLNDFDQFRLDSHTSSRVDEYEYALQYRLILVHIGTKGDTSLGSIIYSLPTSMD